MGRFRTINIPSTFSCPIEPKAPPTRRVGHGSAAPGDGGDNVAVPFARALHGQRLTLPPGGRYAPTQGQALCCGDKLHSHTT